MPSLTVENYIKAIFQICLNGEGQAATGQLASALGVSPGTVTSMLKTLSEGSLVTYTPYEGVRLTPTGTALALRVVRRHRLIELFLVRTLDLNWDEVHEEAEQFRPQSFFFRHGPLSSRHKFRLTSKYGEVAHHGQL